MKEREALEGSTRLLKEDMKNIKDIKNEDIS